jgi:hypothetical protein
MAGIFYGMYDFDLSYFKWVRTGEFDIVTTIVWWLGGLFGGMILIGFAEVINLLYKIFNVITPSNSK